MYCSHLIYEVQQIFYLIFVMQLKKYIITFISNNRFIEEKKNCSNHDAHQRKIKNLKFKSRCERDLN